MVRPFILPKENNKLIINQDNFLSVVYEDHSHNVCSQIESSVIKRTAIPIPIIIKKYQKPVYSSVNP